MQRQLISQDDQRLASLEHARKIHDTILELSTSLACTYRQQQAAASASAAAMSTEILLLQVWCSDRIKRKMWPVL